MVVALKSEMSEISIDFGLGRSLNSAIFVGPELQAAKTKKEISSISIDVKRIREVYLLIKKFK
jgi:hypothetical protein